MFTSVFRGIIAAFTIMPAVVCSASTAGAHTPTNCDRVEEGAAFDTILLQTEHKHIPWYGAGIPSGKLMAKANLFHDAILTARVNASANSIDFSTFRSHLDERKKVGILPTANHEEMVTSPTDAMHDTVMAVPLLRPPAFPTPWSNVSFSGVSNPSLLIQDGKVVIMLKRTHIVTCDAVEASTSMLYSSVYWGSDLVFANMSLDDFRQVRGPVVNASHAAVVPDLRFAKADANESPVECNLKYPPSSMVIASGPEDPRLFQFGDKTYMYYVATDVVSNEVDSLDINDIGQASFDNSACRRGMYIHVAEVIEFEPNLRFGPSAPLLYDDMTLEERGWSMFTWTAPSGEEQLLSIYSVQPHTILRVNPITGISVKISNTSSPLVANLAEINYEGSRTSSIHGGSGVVFVEAEEHSYYLAVLHFYTMYNYPPYKRTYWNYPYKFRPEPPFDIISVSDKPLSLQTDGTESYGGGVAYVSSMNIDHDDLIVGYGQADRIPRIYRQPLDEFERIFFA